MSLIHPFIFELDFIKNYRRVDTIGTLAEIAISSFHLKQICGNYLQFLRGWEFESWEQRVTSIKNTLYITLSDVILLYFYISVNDPVTTRFPIRTWVILCETGRYITIDVCPHFVFITYYLIAWIEEIVESIRKSLDFTFYKNSPRFLVPSFGPSV